MVLSVIMFLQLGLSPLLFCEDNADEREKYTDSSCKPRRCSLQKGPLGFGFHLGCAPHRPGTFISQVGMKHHIAFSQCYLVSEAKKQDTSRSGHYHLCQMWW